ncbi:formate dehydrogenase accessory sulfurtransferase FdhD [Chloroflexota bacterium]
MNGDTKKLPIVRITERGKCELEDIVVKEFSLTIILNGLELVTLLCSPRKLEYLVLGFLQSAGLVEGKDDIRKVIFDDQEGVAKVETKKAVDMSLRPVLGSSGGRTAGFLTAPPVGENRQLRLPASAVFSLVENFVQRSSVFKTTGGVHCAALCDKERILIFSEDIGRHNAIDKVFGECLWNEVPVANHSMITSGRISSEILLKVARRNVTILISKSAPTNQGVKLANDLDITLVGFVRGTRMNVYANDWRIVSHE